MDSPPVPSTPLKTIICTSNFYTIHFLLLSIFLLLFPFSYYYLHTLGTVYLFLFFIFLISILSFCKFLLSFPHPYYYFHIPFTISTFLLPASNKNLSNRYNTSLQNEGNTELRGGGRAVGVSGGGAECGHALRRLEGPTELFVRGQSSKCMGWEALTI